MVISVLTGTAVWLATGLTLTTKGRTLSRVLPVVKVLVNDSIRPFPLRSRTVWSTCTVICVVGGSSASGLKVAIVLPPDREIVPARLVSAADSLKFSVVMDAGSIALFKVTDTLLLT